MTPEYDALIAKINKTGNIANTHGQLKKLVTQYGEALHGFIEDDPLVPAKGGLAALKIKPADFNKASAGIGALLPLAKGMAMGGKVTKSSVANEAKKCAMHAAADEASAAGVVGGGDEASEDYVDAAMWFFRQAISVYLGNDLTNAKLPSAGGTVDTFNAKYEYATALYNAARVLLLAAQNEDPADFAEIIAENLVANLFCTEATKVYSELEKEMDVKKKVTLPAKDRNTFDDNQKAADKGATDTKATLAGIVK